MWRFDAGRTASSPDALPDKLHPLWKRRFTPRNTVWDDPLNHDLMPYDKAFEPVVAGKRMFLGFNDADKVVAIDLAGRSCGRSIPTARSDFRPWPTKTMFIFTSDDGLSCIAFRQTTANSSGVFAAGRAHADAWQWRLISTWPARGGPVVMDDTVYFAASIWPFMGTFIYALDAETGEVRWLNDASASTYIDQPHNSPAFAGVAPKGPSPADKCCSSQAVAAFRPGSIASTASSSIFTWPSTTKPAARTRWQRRLFLRPRAGQEVQHLRSAHRRESLRRSTWPAGRYRQAGLRLWRSVSAYNYENLKPAKSKPSKSLIDKAKSALLRHRRRR